MPRFMGGAGVTEEELWCREWFEGAREAPCSYGREAGKK